MKRKYRIIIPMLSVLLLSGCLGHEPDDTAYVVGLGFDKAENNNYNITIQFARPSQISGGGEEGGKSGESIVENILVEAPDIYSGINTANHLISKQFSLSHTKIVVFSSEVAQEGISDIMETLSLSDDLRPNIITAVSRETAREYFENTKPIVEVNPAKYYQLIYEKNNSGGIPKMSGLRAMFDIVGERRDIVMPLTGVAKASDNSENRIAGEGGEESGSGSAPMMQENLASSQSNQNNNEANQGAELEGEQEKENEEVPLNESGFQYKNRDYKAGQVKIIDEDKSEALGMAVFNGDKMIAELGEKEADIYNILAGEYKENYTSFYSSEVPGKAITVRLTQRNKPSYKIDKENKIIRVKLYLEGDFYALPYGYDLENNVEGFEKESAELISNMCASFITQMRDEYNADIFGIGEKAKRSFTDLKSYEEYNWKEKFKEYSIEVETKFKIRNAGITYRERN